MPFKIVRNDITKMNTEAIVNTANDFPTVGTGCDSAVYNAAGRDKLLAYREKKIGYVPEGDVFITPGFDLKAKFIIHAVSPLYMGGENGEEEKLRSCYRKSLLLARDKGIRSISFPLISTGGFGYPKEEGMRIAVDEINAFLLKNQMEIYLVVFDTKATQLGENIYPELRAFIDHNYVLEKREEEYGDAYFGSFRPDDEEYDAYTRGRSRLEDRLRRNITPDKSVRSEIPSPPIYQSPQASYIGAPPKPQKDFADEKLSVDEDLCDLQIDSDETIFEDEKYDGVLCDYAIQEPESLEDVNWEEDLDAVDQLNEKLKERLSHMADTYSEYFLYLIKQKGLSNPDVYKRAIVDKRYFAKIKKNKHFHPEKLKALCLCVGAMLNLDETKDLLARAGYALSPCDPVDIIFSVYIENKFYSVIDIDILLEELGLPCIIT